MKLQSGFGIKGRYRIHSYAKGALDEYLKDKSKARPAPLRSSEWIDNLVVLNALNGLNIVVRHLAGDDAVSLKISSASIGTGTNAPAITDTDLQTPVLTDIAIARVSNTTTQVVAEFYITDADLADGVYSEFGIFINPTAEKLFARSLITPNHTKSAGEDTLVEYTLTASST